MVWLLGGGAWLLGVGDDVMAEAVVSTWSCAAPKKSCKGLERTRDSIGREMVTYCHLALISDLHIILVFGMQLIGLSTLPHDLG